MESKYQNFNTKIENQIIKWSNELIKHNQTRDEWDSSNSIHITEIHTDFKKRWHWLSASLYVFKYIEESKCIDLVHYDLMLSIFLKKLDNCVNIEKVKSIKDVRRIEKYISSFSPPSFYLLEKERPIGKKFPFSEYMTNIKEYKAFFTTNDFIEYKYYYIDIFHL